MSYFENATVTTVLKELVYSMYVNNGNAQHKETRMCDVVNCLINIVVLLADLTITLIGLTVLTGFGAMLLIYGPREHIAFTFFIISITAFCFTAMSKHLSRWCCTSLLINNMNDIVEQKTLNVVTKIERINNFIRNNAAKVVEEHRQLHENTGATILNVEVVLSIFLLCNNKVTVTELTEFAELVDTYSNTYLLVVDSKAFAEVIRCEFSKDFKVIYDDTGEFIHVERAKYFDPDTAYTYYLKDMAPEDLNFLIMLANQVIKHD